ncbi:hypothetical protein K491DRAFT_213120 [Lophiostoma macrostomum CBS 122681]|uniref:Uncharacterized protein n=1 Tax=Lophiostoma macrostomum CBS 122681 TaxID=1314788 RepID=A0A6A6SNT6_9PLEO|nr:hypothetical protein K491DRAFT_213120 [Lophiostoma macrostomum CBS 122681]
MIRWSRRYLTCRFSGHDTLSILVIHIRRWPCSLSLRNSVMILIPLPTESTFHPVNGLMRIYASGILWAVLDDCMVGPLLTRSRSPFLETTIGLGCYSTDAIVLEDKLNWLAGYLRGYFALYESSEMLTSHFIKFEQKAADLQSDAQTDPWLDKATAPLQSTSGTFFGRFLLYLWDYSRRNISRAGKLTMGPYALICSA